MICDDSSFFATFNNLCHHLFLFSSTILCALVTFHHPHYLYFSQLMMLNTFPCDPRALVCACIFFVWHTSSNFSCSEVIVSFIFLILNYAHYWVDCIFRTNIFYWSRCGNILSLPVICIYPGSDASCFAPVSIEKATSRSAVRIALSSVWHVGHTTSFHWVSFLLNFPRAHTTSLSPLSHQAQTVEVDAHICIGHFIKNLVRST